jgi:trk system potassium uptake protein TrkA
MRILIVGAGKVGSSVAANLVSESNDITIVDQSKSSIAEIQASFDLQGIVGDATSPSVLAEAGAADADMIIAVTAKDETNLAVTLIADELFNIPSRIARVRNSELRQYPTLLSSHGFRATSVIWPEQAITNYIVELIQFPEALQVIEFSSKDLVLIDIRAVKGSEMDGKPVKHLSEVLPDIPVRVLSIYHPKFRESDITGQSVVDGGDEVVFLVRRNDAKTVIRAFRQKVRKSDRVMIVGGGSLGLQLAQALDRAETETGGNYNVKLIDPDESHCLFLSQHLTSSILVLQGEMTDENLFINEGIANTDLFIAISGDDEDNVMSCLLAKKLGAHRAIALINRSKYMDLVDGTEIDVAFSPTEATLSDLLRHIRHGDVVLAHTLRRDGAEVMEIVAHGSPKNSNVVGRSVGEIVLPAGSTIGAIIRSESGKDTPYMAEGSLAIQDGDRVIVFMSNKKLIPAIEKLFSPKFSFF